LKEDRGSGIPWIRDDKTSLAMKLPEFLDKVGL
jgi:hypothetical protein